MRYQFGSYILDADRFELTRDGAVLAAEPQVLSLLLFLIRNRATLVSKDALVEAIWGGRAISDTAISSRIKSARQLVGDSGEAQQVIRTVHGRGFRFVAALTEVGAEPQAGAPAPPQVEEERPSIAILPLHLRALPGPHAIVAEALPQDLIRELARLRWLHVIARGSSFRFAGPTPDLALIRDALGVRYVMSGTLDETGSGFRVAVELADTHDGGVVWAERFDASTGELGGLGEELVSRIVAALELRIPEHEAARVRFTPVDDVGAWSAYHLGLRRMYRFTATDNAAARELFEQAVACNGDLARAHAGLSFTHFQDAFLRHPGVDADAATARARRAAERAVGIDPLDPFANAVMGRANWLSGDLKAGLPWLERAAVLSPSYAQGVYARAWTETLLGHGAAGQTFADRAVTLSPLDPLRYAMLATRALSHVVRENSEDAVAWADKAAREPGAHALIAVIAGLCRALDGDPAGATRWIAVARQRQPLVSREHFLRSFPFADADLRSSITAALAKAGL